MSDKDINDKDIGENTDTARGLHMKEMSQNRDVSKHLQLFKSIVSNLRLWVLGVLIASGVLLALLIINVWILAISNNIPNNNYGLVGYLIPYILSVFLICAGGYSAGLQGNKSMGTKAASFGLVLAGVIIQGLELVIMHTILLGIKTAYSSYQCYGVAQGTVTYTGVPTSYVVWSDSTAVCKNVGPGASVHSFTIFFVTEVLSLFIWFLAIGMIILKYSCLCRWTLYFMEIKRCFETKPHVETFNERHYW